MNLIRPWSTSAATPIPLTCGQVEKAECARHRRASRGDAAQSEGDGMAVTVDVVEELGSGRFLYCAGDFRTVDAEAGGDGPAVLTARLPGDSAIGVGERIMQRPHHDQAHMFSPTTGQRLD
jgi:hypothetical protein